MDESKNNDIQVIQNELPVYEQSQRAAIDMQIEIAKKYPRIIKRATEECIAIVTMDEKTASTCGYSLPRANKQITGASVHLARIIAQQWKNLRIEARGTMISDKYVTAEAVAFDLENNYAVKIESRRKIIDSKGRRYNDDLINLAMLATTAIAYRNAVFAVVPKSIIDTVYQAAQNKLVGDVTDKQKLIGKQKQVFDAFIETFGVTEKEILTLYGKQNRSQFDKELLVSLIGLGQALRDGDTTIDETFKDKENPDGEKVKEKAEQFEKEEDDQGKDKSVTTNKKPEQPQFGFKNKGDEKK